MGIITGKQQVTHRHHLFRGSGRGRPFHRGDFKYIILRHISEKPSYGYEIIRALEERFHSFYVPSPGSVYPTLQMMEEMGYAIAAETEGKKVYSITKEGLEFLEEQKDSDERIKTRMERWWNPENINEIQETMDEFEKLAGLLREKARDADTKKLARMKKAISRAYQEI
ncbi:MAG: PadR family transcriptional regulator, partial [Dehalococcoidales bacterium]